MIDRCTWATKPAGELVGSPYVRCEQRATAPQHDKVGRVWANLCTTHAAELEAAIIHPDVRKMVAAWVKASGGATKLAETM